MSFIYDDRKHAAVDSIRGITIERSGRFHDISDEMAYVYKAPTFSFEFFVTTVEERRTFLFQGKSQEALVDVAAFVVEPSLKRGLRMAFGDGTPQREYEAVRADIAKGIFAILTKGGASLERVPEFHVGFVDRPGDVLEGRNPHNSKDRRE